MDGFAFSRSESSPRKWLIPKLRERGRRRRGHSLERLCAMPLPRHGASGEHRGHRRGRPQPQPQLHQLGVIRAILRTLCPEEMTEYRRPFAELGEGRRPTLTFPREIPIEGEPADVAEIVSAYGAWLAKSNVPMLFIKAEPGALLAVGANLATARSWPSQTEVTVKGVHFVQEDSPNEIGRAIADWMRRRSDGSRANHE